ncbi:hypothetical protein N8I77_009366 [Diaporthe amygdali]|uniref:C2H2-type zinc finger ascomycetes domain-containing protein n=1 Tax=Phomopsis amygdali TaxID=1214568 RepID=A0AAD9SA02_PHOAM|nr:hypothetical protein N8I77_009366 [Diaporthe amygdali]
MPTGRSIGCPGCPACVYPSKIPGYSHDQYDFRKCIIQIFWELTDSPSTLQKLKLGTKAQLRELLVASSQFAAEVGDDKLIIISLASLQHCLEIWRLHINGLLYHGMHKACGTGPEDGCRFKCFADLQNQIDKYAIELSRVFFRKRSLQSDRRWWLSVFYSLCIQASVRQTLSMVQAEVNVRLTADPYIWSQYCYIALNMFDAASAGWDPITSDQGTGHLLSGSALNQKLARHIAIARKTILENFIGDLQHNSFEFLKNLFEMDKDAGVVVRRQVLTQGTSSRHSTAMNPQPALAIPIAEHTPRFSDSEHASTDDIEYHGSETEDRIHPPALPYPRLVQMDSWEGLRGYAGGTNKRRATSPPEDHDSMRRPSTDSFSRCLSTPDDVSDRTNSISSVNSFSSINAAYGTLALDSPGSGFSSEFMTGRSRAGRPPAIYMCNCCPKKPKSFETRDELE